MKTAVDQRAPAWTDLEVLTEASECLRTLAHPIRLRMVEMLLAGCFTVGELADACGIASPAASGHLRLLERCGLLCRKRSGRAVHYEVAEPCLREIILCIKRRFCPKG